MSLLKTIYRRFHPLVQQAYSTTHKWIEENIQESKGYKSVSYKNLRNKLQQTDWKHIAFQYYSLFPAHYFKAIHVLDTIVGEKKILSWLRHQQKICVLDIGCGGGAASAAFLDVVIKLKEDGKLMNDLKILIIGVDPVCNAIALYSKTMENLKLLTNDLFELEFQAILQGFPDAVLNIEKYLKDEIIKLQSPCLNQIFVMQLNVISPFSQSYKNRQSDLNHLRALGIKVELSSVEDNEGFGTAEAQAYKHLIDSVPIDIMHILTIGTKNMENQVQVGTNSNITLRERIEEMLLTFEKIIGNRHLIERINSDNHSVNVENPISSYWRDKGKERTKENQPIKFYADFCTVYSGDREEDKDWNEIISLENLRLAWARARNHLFHEALYDETEIRLLESNLEVRLEILREQLYAYANDIALSNELISYKFPKNLVTTRPRGLTRIEEEILSVAIIQKLGNKASQLRGNSYAYRISGASLDTEYLYQYWFSAYCNYMRTARNSAKKYPNGAILKVDIQSFYTKILQEQLCNELSRELTFSERVRWLIRLLLSKEIPEHDVGQGLTQGSIGSGFYANLYLTSIDTKFGSGNEWEVELHRYVDDMIFVIPNSEDLNIIEDVLRGELKSLGLNFNESKTEKIYNVATFLEQSDEDEYLEELSQKFDSIVNLLWILNSDHRAIFEDSYHQDNLWWHNIECYKKCLKSIKIYINETELSRKIYKYLFNVNAKKREREISKQKEIFGIEGELKSTKPLREESLSSLHQWTSTFSTANKTWINHKNDLRRELAELLQSSWQKLRNSETINHHDIRKLQRYIRFSLYRLSVLGFEDIVGSLMDILRESFWIIRDPINIIESLARHGYLTEVRSLLTHYQNLEEPVEYMKAISIRAMRFLPSLNAQEWEIIVELATVVNGSVSLVERLMATETWLYLGHKYNDFKQSHHLEAVKAALRFEQPQTSRLQKNYLLILGQFEPHAVQEFSVNPNDPMLVTAKEVALQGNSSEIFDVPELKILRENYYTGQGPRDSEEGSP